MGLLDTILNIASGAQAIQARAKLARQADVDLADQRQNQILGLLMQAGAQSTPQGDDLSNVNREKLAYLAATIPGQESVWGPSVTAQNTAGINYNKEMMKKIMEGRNSQNSSGRYYGIDWGNKGLPRAVDKYTGLAGNIPLGAIDPNTQNPAMGGNPYAGVTVPGPYGGALNISVPQATQGTQSSQGNVTPFVPQPDVTEYEKAAMPALVKAQEKYSTDAASANALSDTMYQVDNLLKDYPTGTGGQFILGAQKFFSQLFGMDFAGMGEAQAANAIASRLALEYRSTAGGGGMPGNLSDKDLQFLQKMVPNLMMTSEGRKYLVKLAEVMRINKNILERKAAEYNPYYPKFQGKSFRAYMNEVINGPDMQGGTFAEHRKQIEDIVKRGQAGEFAPGKNTSESSYEDFMRQ